MISITTTTPQETFALGHRLGANMKKGDIVCLTGDLGSGKTTLIKGVAKGMHISEDEVHSPTFVLMNIYEGKRMLYHFDLYRLERLEEISAIGCDEFFYGDGVSVIEWADRLGENRPKECLQVELEHKGENRRAIKITPKGKRYLQMMQSLKNKKRGAA